jgi:hypothetical protein
MRREDALIASALAPVAGRFAGIDTLRSEVSDLGPGVAWLQLTHFPLRRPASCAGDGFLHGRGGDEHHDTTSFALGWCFVSAKTLKRVFSVQRNDQWGNLGLSLESTAEINCPAADADLMLGWSCAQIILSTDTTTLTLG